MVKFLPRLELYYRDWPYRLSYPALLVLGLLCGPGVSLWTLVSPSLKHGPPSRSSGYWSPSLPLPFPPGCVSLLDPVSSNLSKWISLLSMPPISVTGCSPVVSTSFKVISHPKSSLLSLASLPFLSCTLQPPPTPISPVHSSPKPPGSPLENLGRRHLTQDGYPQNGGNPGGQPCWEKLGVPGQMPSTLFCFPSPVLVINI